MSHDVIDIIQYLSICITNVLLFLFLLFFLSLSFRSVYIFRLAEMSEQKIQDENGAATEQNPMVQRISLEVKRREPSSVSIILIIIIFKELFPF